MWLATSIPLLLFVGAGWCQALQAGWKARNRQEEIDALDAHSWPSVSILLPAWAEARVIDRCLDALHRVRYPHWEVIIIAGGEDQTYEKVSRLHEQGRYKVLPQGAGGKNAALNQGLERAEGQVIVVLDADSIVSPDWLHALVHPLLHGADATSGNFLPVRRTWVSQTEEMEKIATCLIDQRYTLQGSGSIAVWRAALEQVGGFPAAVTTGVDWDLSVRLEKAGRTLHFSENACVWTQRPATLSEFWINEVRWRRAHMRSLFSHRSWFFRTPAMILSSGRLYGLMIAIGVSMAMGLLLCLFGHAQVAGRLYQVVGVILITLGARKAALAAQIAVYARDPQWLSLFWAPALLLLVSYVASWWAMLTFSKNTVHFKGPR